MDWQGLIKTIGSGINLKDFSTSNTEPDYGLETKGLFGDKEEKAKLEAEILALKAKEKKSADNLMYGIGALILAMVLGIIKFK